MKKPIGKLLSALSAALCLMSVPVFAADGVAINETNFPDSTFRTYVSDNFDTDGNGSLSATEISAVQEISVNENGIGSLKGIECFENLKQLDCTFNQLTELDVSKNTVLTYLDCSQNQLTSLDVSKNTALTKLECYSNQLTELDVSKNTALITLRCDFNNLTSLDASKNTALTYLTCGDNQLASLDVSGATALKELTCWDNQLTELDVSKNAAMTTLHCESNQLTKLDVSGAAALEYLDCMANQLTKLDVSRNTALEVLSCGADTVAGIYNQLTVLDVSKNTALTTLWCNGNQLTELDVSKNAALTGLDCGYNQLTSLDVSKNTALTYLSCYGNTYTIEVGKDNTFALSSLPNFDVTKASNWVGGTVNGTILTVNANTETVTYDYDCDRSYDSVIMSVTLNVTVKSEPDPGPDPDPEPEKPEFVDVPSGAYYADAVDWAAATGVTAGVDNTHFGPDEGCTRAQMVSFLWRAAGEPEPETTESPFTDVKNPNEYYYKAVLWAAENGIAAGIGNNLFAPNQTCTRAQIVSFIYRAVGDTETYTENPFKDVSPKDYYYKAVLWGAANGVVAGTSDTTFSPNETCTRAQGVSFLYRVYGD